MRKLAAVLLVIVLSLSTAAIAATPKSGKWKGNLYGSHSGKLSFKVNKGKTKLTKFYIPTVVVVCGLDIRTITIGVPSAKISKSGKFKRTYKFNDTAGREIKYTLKGKFKSKGKASGTVNAKTTSCNVDLKFRASK
jgi:hypothetical protein